MKNQHDVTRLVRRWNLAALFLESVPGTNHQVVRLTLANAKSGLRGGRYRNVRTVTVSAGDLAEIYGNKTLRLHADFRSSTN